MQKLLCVDFSGRQDEKTVMEICVFRILWIDGMEIWLEVRIDKDAGTAEFDVTDTDWVGDIYLS